MNSRYSTIAVPPDIKKALEDRAGERPIFRMLAEEFLDVPDMQQVMETRFSYLNERLDNLEKRFESFKSILEKHQELLASYNHSLDEMNSIIFPALKREFKNINTNFVLADRRLTALEEKVNNG